MPLKSVVQLVIPKLQTNLNIKSEGEICEVCGKTRYSSKISDYFPKPDVNNFDIIKTKEFFGTGHVAFNRILVSNDFMNDLISNKVARIHQFVPTK
jgi:hypothetical protein